MNVLVPIYLMGSLQFFSTCCNFVCQIILSGNKHMLRLCHLCVLARLHAERILQHGNSTNCSFQHVGWKQLGAAPHFFFSTSGVAWCCSTLCRFLKCLSTSCRPQYSQVMNQLTGEGSELRNGFCTQLLLSIKLERTVC